MKQFFSVVFALVIAVSLAACTRGNNDATTLATTTSTTLLQTTTNPSQEGGSTTTIETTTTTKHSDQSTTDISNVTTTVPTTTTTTQKNEDGVAFYAQYPNVPDYGALVGVEHTWLENNIFYYRADLVAQADPQNKGASQYMQLLQNCGYLAYQPYDKDGVQGYIYVNVTSGTTVLFGAAREQGVIVVAISQQ